MNIYTRLWHTCAGLGGWVSLPSLWIRENMFLCFGSRPNINYERIPSCVVGCQLRTRAQSLQISGISATHDFFERTNHSVMALGIMGSWARNGLSRIKKKKKGGGGGGGGGIVWICIKLSQYIYFVYHVFQIRFLLQYCISWSPYIVL